VSVTLRNGHGLVNCEENIGEGNIWPKAKAVAEICRTLCNEHLYLNSAAYVIKKQISEDKMNVTVVHMWGMWNKCIVDFCKVGTSWKSCIDWRWKYVYPSCTVGSIKGSSGIATSVVNLAADGGEWWHSWPAHFQQWDLWYQLNRRMCVWCGLCGYFGEEIDLLQSIANSLCCPTWIVRWHVNQY
jgi:hypothetical protein